MKAKALRTLFIDVFQSEESKSLFRAADISIALFLRWLHANQTNAAFRILEIVAETARKRAKGSHSSSIFGAVEYKTLRELGTEQLRPVNCTALIICLLAVKDRLVNDMFSNVFLRFNIPLSYINAGAYHQLQIQSGERKRKAGSIPGSLEPPSPTES